MSRSMIDLIKHRVEMGIGSPYDERPARADDLPRVAALAVLADLTDRRGIKQALENVDKDVGRELTDSITETIRYVMSPEFKFDEHTEWREKVLRNVNPTHDRIGELARNGSSMTEAFLFLSEQHKILPEEDVKRYARLLSEAPPANHYNHGF